LYNQPDLQGFFSQFCDQFALFDKTAFKMILISGIVQKYLFEWPNGVDLGADEFLLVH